MTVRLCIEKRRHWETTAMLTHFNESEILDDLDNRLLLRWLHPIEHGVQQVLIRMAEGWTGLHRGNLHATIDCGDYHGHPLSVYVEYNMSNRSYIFKGKLDGKLVGRLILPEYKMIERKINET